MDDSFTITCPPTYTNKVSVIKSIRMLTGLGLKDAKDASERTYRQIFKIDKHGFLRASSSIDEFEGRVQKEFELLRAQGVRVSGSAWTILDDLSRLGKEAEKNGHADLAAEIELLLTAEKLRRER